MNYMSEDGDVSILSKWSGFTSKTNGLHPHHSLFPGDWSQGHPVVMG